ncbi:unnamed protein product [Sphagnum balticum]
MWTYPYNITRFLIVNEVGTIFMGTSLGKVRAHQWPFTDSMKFSKHFTEVQLHGAAVTDLRISHDYNLLISGGEDGSVFISRVNAFSDGIPVNGPRGEECGTGEQPIEVAVGHRDYLIKQVVNTNNLRKIDDSIRRTIMVKLNRETVSLTCEVNELRKEKKTLISKVRELQSCLKDLKEDGCK